ncbi:serine hydrolase-domain-containing protein [Xylariaceae sp. FL0662B]|nr:serine hydrolase-domain-containing protein [Xylariaceae sp. FL0662B]
MKFLCLPGAYGSAKNFGVQLGPIAKCMEERGLATFAYTQGGHEVEPPVGWENYFGSRPLYRFVNVGTGTDAFEMIRRVRHIPRGLSPEATMRKFKTDEKPGEAHTRMMRGALDDVIKTIDADPEIDAIIGYSEGAMIAASICCEENRRWKEAGIPPRIKFAIFFAGTPPVALEGNRLVCKLADECGTLIEIPTFHVFGSSDPLVYSCVSLYNVCNQDTAQLYDHGLGHLVPRDADNVEQIGDILAGIIAKIEEEKEEEKEEDNEEDKEKRSGAATPISEFTEDSAEINRSTDSIVSEAESRSSHGSDAVSK